jgi:uncharacterized protein YjbI with pentapeptide repeats
VAILREQPPGNFQKLLADALTQAPKELLAGADIQKANLQNAWLGQIDLPKADFYRADLSDASFKEATAEGVKFYEARLAASASGRRNGRRRLHRSGACCRGWRAPRAAARAAISSINVPPRRAR